MGGFGECEECSFACSQGNATMPELIKQHRAGHPNSPTSSVGRRSSSERSARRGSHPDSVNSAGSAGPQRSLSAASGSGSGSGSGSNGSQSGRGSPSSMSSAHGSLLDEKRLNANSPGPTSYTDNNGDIAAFIPSLTIRRPPGAKSPRPVMSPDGTDIETPKAVSPFPNTSFFSMKSANDAAATGQADAPPPAGPSTAPAVAANTETMTPPASPIPNITIEFCDRCRWLVMSPAWTLSYLSDDIQGPQSNMDTNGAVPHIPHARFESHHPHSAHIT